MGRVVVVEVIPDRDQQAHPLGDGGWWLGAAGEGFSGAGGVPFAVGGQQLLVGPSDGDLVAGGCLVEYARDDGGLALACTAEGVRPRVLSLPAVAHAALSGGMSARAW
ncbi:MAG TPA: hypothetical protein VGS06_18995 [Streptosporangiaceae bacterium]|nr:hypothetical protein [Streptosporangiaceae bacterium]